MASLFSSDDPLLDRLRQGDATALGEFIESRRAPLLAYINSQLGARLRRKVEPDDVLQEVSAEAVRAFPTMDWTSLEPFGWLCQLSQRRIIDAHRRFFASQKRDAAREVALDARTSYRGAGLVNMLVASMTSPSQAFSRDQRYARLHDALAKLPPEQHEALRLRYLEGLPSKEVAQRLDKSDGAVRVMLSRALSRVRQVLAEGETQI